VRPEGFVAQPSGKQSEHRGSDAKLNPHDQILLIDPMFMSAAGGICRAAVRQA